jgi:hypothetical protein
MKIIKRYGCHKGPLLGRETGIKDRTNFIKENAKKYTALEISRKEN